MGILVILRDWEGRVIATLRSTRELYPDALLGEATALLKTTILCIEMGLQQVIFEGDALTVVNAINGSEERWNSVRIIIRDVKKMLENVNHWPVRYVPRNVKNVAHTLAKSALGLSKESFHKKIILFVLIICSNENQ